MMKFRSLTILFCLATLGSGLCVAQATNSNPATHDAPVFLDNHRPSKKKDKTPTTRNLSGKVVDVNGSPLAGALVTLTDDRTKGKTTFITKSDGRYRFDELSFSIDYQLQALYKGFAAPSRKLSQYDHNPNVVRILEVDDSENGSTSSSAEAKKGPPPKS